MTSQYRFDKNTSRIRQPLVHIVGAAAMGLASAICISRSARKHGIDMNVVVYEKRKVGGDAGDDFTSGARCQAWGHSGMLFAMTQPQVALTLRPSIRKLQRWAKDAFRKNVLSLAVVPPKYEESGKHYQAICQALGIRFDRIPNLLAEQLAPSLGGILDDETKVYTTDDRPFDLSVVNSRLHQRAIKETVRFNPQGVRRIQPGDNGASALILDDNSRIPLYDRDILVLACSRRIPTLLGDIGIETPIRLFQSQLVGTTNLQQDVLLAEVMGGPTTVPHRISNQRLLTILGDSGRIPVDPQSDRIQDSPELIEQIVHRASESFGIDVSTDNILTWPAVKAEVVGDQSRSQSHYVARVPELENTFMALPGKMSGAPEAAQDLANLIIKNRLKVGRSIWETPYVEVRAKSRSTAETQ